MGIRIAFFFLFLCICSLIGSAQPAAVEPILQKYSASEKTSKQPSYYLLQLKSSASLAIRNLLTLKAQRILSDSIFVIDTMLLNEISRHNPSIEQLLAANNYWKLSPGAAQMLAYKRGKVEHTQYQILFKDIKSVDRILRENPGLTDKNIFILGEQKILSFTSSSREIEKIFLNDDEVILIDVVKCLPKAELGTPGYDLSANKINLVHSQYPSITGLHQHVSIKEDFFDTTDIDLKGRFELSPLASGNITNHANFMATIIAGAGNSAYFAKGAAFEAMVSSSSFATVLPDSDNSYLLKNITVQNHSYGTVIENNYGLGAVAFDKSANNNEGLLHVISSGNSGTGTGTIGNYAGIAGFANLTGNFKMAKNIITVGAVDSFGISVPLSSKGPAYDGRIKPELVAFQKNGTSEAAALVSGTALLLQQYYHKLHPQNMLTSAMAKAILINSADDIGAPGPDFTTGFGNLNAMSAMNIVRDNKLFTGIISQGATQSIPILVPENISLLKITLVWNDKATSPIANKSLVNDLDLEVGLPNTSLTWKPWVLNSAANIDSLNKLPERKRDSVNNVEQVTIKTPQPGSYEIKINGHNLPTGSQQYHLVYSWDSLHFFKWQKPASTDYFEASSHAVLRWQNSFIGNGSIELSIVSSNAWLPVASNVDLQKGHVYWDVPDTIARANLRMKIGDVYFYSDTFLITTLLKPTTGYICGDSVLIYWAKLKNINRYQLYQLGEKFMEPLFSVTDSFAVVPVSRLKDQYLAVAPMMNNGITLQKSYGFNYTTQGTGCFINAFFVDKNADVARLTLSLGTLMNVADINFEKLAPAGYAIIKSFLPGNQLQFVFDYDPLQLGITYFRAKITLMNGQVIYSKPEAVFYTAPGKYVLLPMPVPRNNDLILITNLPDGETFSLIDVLGRIMLKQEIHSSRETIKTASLQAGQYFYRITKQGNRLTTGKLIIL